jgi:hypothetical protein
MPIEKISAEQYAEQIRSGILNRDRTWEVTVGEVPDTCINPQARVWERQNDRTRQLSLMLSLSDASVFDDEFEADLEGIVFNEGLSRSLGSASGAVAVFSRVAPPANNVRVQRGYPIATLADEDTGTTITFVTTEEGIMLASASSSYYNIDTERYELNVPVVAVIEGSEGQVGARRISRPLRALVGFDSVANPNASTGGRDRESNQELIDRYLIAILGRRLEVRTGLKKWTEDEFGGVEDAQVIGGTDALLTRAADTAGAVDIYIIGEDLVEVSDNITYLGAGQLIEVNFAPLVEVVSVRDLSGPTTFTEGTDYEVVFDDSGVSGSTRAADGVKFLPTGSAPALGDLVTITYTYNNLIRTLQNDVEDDDVDVDGRDELYKMSTKVGIFLDAGLRVTNGFNQSTVRTAVRTAILAYINGLKGGDDVEEFDIDGVVSQISGVDNFVYNQLSRITVTSGVGDIAIARNEYARFLDETTDLVINFI